MEIHQNFLDNGRIPDVIIDLKLGIMNGLSRERYRRDTDAIQTRYRRDADYTTVMRQRILRRRVQTQNYRRVMRLRLLRRVATLQVVD